MPILTRRFFGGFIALLCLGGCVSAPQSTSLLERFDNSSAQASAFEFPSQLLLSAVPFFPQDQYQCGPAALATVLQASQVSVLPDALVSQVYVPDRQGSLQIEMLAAARRYGRIAYVLPPTLEALFAELEFGRPVLVMQNLGLNRFPQWHYAVAVGYDLEERELILRSGHVKDYRLALSTFERTWQRAQHWAVVLLAPGELAETVDENRYFESVSAFALVGTEQALLAAYEAGLNRWPSSVALRMGVGNLHYEKNRLTKAREYYSAVLDESPLYAAAHNNLAQVLFELGDARLAQTHAEQAVYLGGQFSDSYKKTLATINEVLLTAPNN